MENFADIIGPSRHFVNLYFTETGNI